MPMYNLIEYSKNYRKTTGSLWNYYRDELTDDTNDINFPNKNVINSDSFKIVRKGFPGPIFNAPTPWPSLKVKGILIMTLSTFCQPTPSPPPSPILRRPAPASYFHPLFKNFQIPPSLWGRQSKFTPCPFKKRVRGGPNYV